MKVIRAEGGVVAGGASHRVALVGDLDLATADSVRAELLALVTPGVVSLELDLAALDFLDSSGLSVLIDLAGRTEVVLLDASAAVRRVLAVTGLTELFEWR